MQLTPGVELCIRCGHIMSWSLDWVSHDTKGKIRGLRQMVINKGRPFDEVGGMQVLTVYT